MNMFIIIYTITIAIIIIYNDTDSVFSASRSRSNKALETLLPIYLRDKVDHAC